LKQFVEHVVSSVDEGDILQFGSVSNVLLAVRLGKGACPGPARGTPPGQPRTAGAGVQHTGGSSAAPGRALIVDGLGGGERSREERMAGAAVLFLRRAKTEKGAVAEKDGAVAGCYGTRLLHRDSSHLFHRALWP
jgi:hypothetical protein